MKLFAFERRRARLIGQALVPPGVLGGRLDGVDSAEVYDRYLSVSPWWTALAVRLALWVTWYSPPFFLRRLRTLGGLSADERVQCLEALFVARPYAVREMAMLLKMAWCFVAMGRHDVIAHLGAYRLDEPSGAPLVPLARSAGGSERT